MRTVASSKRYPSQRDTNWKKNVTLAVVLLSALAIGFSLNYYGPFIRQKIHEIVQEDINTPAGSIWERDNRPPVLLPQSPTPAKASTAPQRPRDVPAPPVHTSISAVSPRESPSRASAQTEQNLFDLPGAIYVSPAEMERNLIASRVPIYPETARLEGLQGRVVAQALISKSGSVTRVHVIEGEPILRDAATEAILQRRYRPYRISGSAGRCHDLHHHLLQTERLAKSHIRNGSVRYAHSRPYDPKDARRKNFVPCEVPHNKIASRFMDAAFRLPGGLASF